MTIPHMMNCGHSEDGWCIPCVSALGEERNRLDAENERLRAACREAVACISAFVLGRVMGQPFAPGAEAEINRVTDLLNAALAGESPTDRISG